MNQAGLSPTLLVAGAFILTFLIVCVLGLLLVPRVGSGRSPTDEARQPSVHPTRAQERPHTLSDAPRRDGGWWAVLFLGALAGGVAMKPQWLLRPDAMSLLGGALLLGLPLARRFCRPQRFRIGIFVLAVAFMTFWPMQYAAAGVALPFWELNAALHLLGFFISGALLSGGLETIRRARNTPRDDSWEFL